MSTFEGSLMNPNGLMNVRLNLGLKEGEAEVLADMILETLGLNLPAIPAPESEPEQ